MSKIKPGQIGDFSGKIGQVVVAPWRGLTVGRSAPKKTSKNATLAQLQQRLKFGLVTRFLSPFGDVITRGFPARTGNLSAKNLAASLNLKNAVTGMAPDYEIDYPMVVLGTGKLNGVFGPQAVCLPDNGGLKVSWTINEIDSIGTQPDDEVCVMVYHPKLGKTISHLSLAKRSDLTGTLRLPFSYAGDEIHVWIILFAADGKSASESTYLGKHLVID